MSSKSRKKNPPPKAAGDVPAAAQPSAPSTGAASAADDEHGLLSEDHLHVPKGKSRLQYAFMIGLLVFLTVIFLIPGAILQTFQAGGRDDVEFLAFNGPGGGRVVLHSSEFFELRTGFEEVFDLGPQEIGFLRFFLGIQNPRRVEDAEAARLIVLDRLAQDAGIVITDAELADFLTSMQGMTADIWRQITQRYGGPKKVEPNLKRVLGIRRYLDLMSQLARVPDVAAIEERWADEHIEIAYDYVEVATEGLVEIAKAGAPDDAGLEAWLDERPDFEKSRFFDPAQYRATVAVVRTPDAASGLVERYPDTSGETPEARAESYYNAVFFTRFQRPEEEAVEEEGDGEGEEGDEQAPVEPPSQFLQLDEVRDICTAEAPGFFAARAWIADLRSRVDAGEELDFRAEAEALGLEIIAVDEPSTLEEIREDADLGAFVVGPVSSTQPNQVAPSPVVQESGIHVVFVDERLEPGLPPFAEIRDEVLESWAGERAKELAVEQLTALRDGFEEFTPAEDDEEEIPGIEGEDDEEVVHRKADEAAFLAAAQAAGFEVQRRGWLDKSGAPTADPDAEKDGHRFLQSHREYADLEEGEVPEPALNPQKTHAYLVRVVGKRDMDISRMTPAVYQSYKNASASEPSNQVRQFLTGEGLDQAYGISWLVEPPDEEADEDEADEEAADEEAAE